MAPEPFELYGSSFMGIDYLYMSEGPPNIIAISLLLTEMLVPEHGQKSTFFTFLPNLTRDSA
jgi:hypothetical protein